MALIGLLLHFRGCRVFGQPKYGATAIQCNSITFLILKIQVCFSLQFSKFTPRVGQIYPRLRTSDAEGSSGCVAVSKLVR